MTPDALHALAREAAEKIYEMHREKAGWTNTCVFDFGTPIIIDALRTVAQQTREDCAQIADQLAAMFLGTVPLTDGIRRASLKISADIRAHGGHKP